MFSPARRLFNANEIFYAFGNTRFQNILDGFNKKAPGNAQEPIKVLFLGCGDIRNALYTASKTALESPLEICLNDYQPVVITRNILLLHIISKSSFSTNNVEDAEYLWDVWYNAVWPETTAKRFLSDIKDLMEKKLPSNVKIPDPQDWEKVCYVLHEWEKILRKMTVSNLVQMREEFIEKQFISQFSHQAPFQASKGKGKEHKLEIYADVVATTVGSKLSLEKLSKGIRESIHQEITAYFLTGVCWRPSISGQVSVNPTFLNPVTHKWRVNTADCPFDGYLPLEKGELNLARQKGIMHQTCREILKECVAKYKERMATIEIHLNIADALEFCFNDSPAKFDVIDSSNLADHLGLANVLISCSHKLSEQPGTRILTGSLHWPAVAPTCYYYIEDGLCCPVSLAPTFYGLRVMNQPELGISHPPYAEDEIHHYARLCFEKTEPFENITLGLSEPLRSFIRKLTKKCFTREIQSQCPVGTQYYSPLTFAYIMANLKRRLEAGGGGLKVMPRPDVPEKFFNLARRAIADWSLGKPVKLYTLKAEPLFGFAALNQILPLQPCHLRIALLPPEKCYGLESMLCYRLQGSDPKGVHFIDNVRCDVIKNSEGCIETIEFSFFLPEDHQLSHGYTGALMDVHGLQPVVKFDSLDDFKVETLQSPFPFRTGNAVKTDRQKRLMVEWCTETIDSYILHLKGYPDFTWPASKLKVTSNRKAPCRSAHTLKMSFDGMGEMEPLKLTFPIPIIVDKADISYNEQTIGLHLPKASFELWPSDYEDKAPKMNPDALFPWKSDPDDKQTQLTTHLRDQFAEHIRKFDDQRPLVGALLTVRVGIKELFYGLSKRIENFVVSYCHASEGKNEQFLMKAHLPIRKSPSGVPMVLLTVLDLRQSRRLKKQGKLTKSQLENMKKIFGSSRDRGEIDVCTKYDRNLWGYILKLNSLKIMPSKWQSTKFPTNGPLIATFVSPLYTEIVSARSSMCTSDQLGSLDVASQEYLKEELIRSCENCGRQGGELKRCGRCKKVSYCSTACQKKDWPSHKAGCVARK